MLSIDVIQNGFRNGSKDEPKRVTNFVVMRAPDCSTWAQQSSKCVIFFAIATCKPRSNGTPIGCRIVRCARSECATCCRRRISMPAEGDNVDEVKEQLRRDLLPCFEAATLTNAVFSVLTSVGNKGLKRDEVARKIGQHLSDLPGIVRPAQFLERLINNRPLELSQVIEQSRRDEILRVVRSLKPGWQKAKRPRRIKSENDRVKRKRDSKRRHERKRSAEWLDKVGLIDHEFGKARFS